MRFTFRFAHGVLLATTVFFLASAGAHAQTIVGWRGDWTGKYPDADPPTRWYCRPVSPVYGLRCQAAKPQAGDTGENAKVIWAGDVNEWLALGAFNARDDKTALDESFLDDETKVEPAEGDKAGELSWKALILEHYQEVVRDPKRKYRFRSGGAQGLGWYDRPVRMGDQGGNSQVAYAHTYLYAATAGTASFILNHGDGIKAWVNGKEVYKNPSAFWNWNIYTLSRVYLFRPDYIRSLKTSSQFNAELQKGWNRLLLKVAKKRDKCYFTLRITTPPDTKYEQENIVWSTRLPSWSWSSPILVKDRIFVTSEPDELVCIDKATGKILWRRSNTIYDTVPPEERAKNPIFKEIEPLAAELARGVDEYEGLMLRSRITALLLKVDKEKYEWIPDGKHQDEHIAAYGYTCRTPVSDGQFVYAHFHTSVVVCYDLEGNRQWIQNVRDLGYASDKAGKGNWHAHQASASPVLIDDKLIVCKGWLRAFDKKTGKIVWDTGLLDKTFDASHGGLPMLTCAQSCVPGRIGGVDFVIGFHGRFVRASDGKVMAGPTTNIMTHSTPVIDGDIAYIWGGHRYQMSVQDGEIKLQSRGRTPHVEYSSGLVYDGLLYVLDCRGILNVYEALTSKLVYSQDLEMTPLYHYNAIGAVPSVCLAGKYIYLLDNQGACVIVEPGRTYKQVAVNRIDTMMQHPYPISTMERFDSTPTFDGKHMFIRGERNLYCIGEGGR